MGTKLRVPGSAIATAIARLVLATLLLYFSVSDVVGFGLVSEMDDGWAIAYALVATALAVVAWRSWWWDFRLRTVAFAVDVAIVMVIEHIEPVHYGFFTTGVSIATFALLSTALRFGERATFRAALVLNVVGGAICLARNTPYFYSGMHSTGEIDLLMDVRHIVFHAVISGLAVWLSRQMTPVPRLTRFDPDGGGIDRGNVGEDDVFAAALGYALGVTGAAEGVLLWRAKGRPVSTIIGLDAAGQATFPAANGGGVVPDRDRIEPALFTGRARHALTLDGGGEMAIMAHSFSADGIVARAGFGEGLSLPVQCASGLAWIVLTRCRRSAPTRCGRARQSPPRSPQGSIAGSSSRFPARRR